MDFVYLFVLGSEWEDVIVFLSKEDAIQESIKFPKHRVEIFSKTNTSGYRPTYNYYQNGELIAKS
jgi:hypothetical protein